MGKTLNFLVVLWLSVSVSGSGFGAEEKLIRGNGATLCRAFSRLRSEDTASARRTELAHYQWAYGFLASAQLHSSYPARIGKSPEQNERFLTLILDYCLSNGDSRFFEAVNYSMESLAKSEIVGTN